MKQTPIEEVFGGIEGEITDEELTIVITGMLYQMLRSPLGSELFPVMVASVLVEEGNRSFMITTASGLRYRVKTEFLEEEKVTDDD